MFDFEGGSSSTLTRTPTGLIQTRLIYSRGKDKDSKVDDVLPRNVLISPSLFTSDSGSITVHASNGPCDSGKPPAGPPVRFALTGTIQVMCLFVPELPSDGKYTGNLVIESEKTDVAVKPLAVSRATAAPSTSLVVGGPNRVDLTIMNPFENGSAPRFVVTVQEKTGKTPIEGLYVRLEVVSSPAGYDLNKIDFTLNDAPANDLAVMKTTDARRIPPGGQVKVGVTLNDLRPGEYNLVFRFAGVNTGTDDTQKLTLPVRVHHHWIWAVLLLFVASLVSFAAGKVVAAKRKRVELLRKIGELRPPWLTAFDQILPVVWVGATLDLAETLSKRFWLTAPDEIDRRVNGVSNHLKALDQARRLRDRLRSKLHPMAFRKVDRILMPAIGELGQSPLDDAALERFQTELAGFEDWLKPDKFAATLWDAIQGSLRDLQSNIQRNPPAQPSKVFTALKDKLDTNLKTLPTTAADVEDAYLTYAKLKTFWVVRGDEKVSKECEKAESLITASSSGADLERFFNIADKCAWEQLKKAPGVQIDVPVATHPAAEAFTPLRFAVNAPKTDDDETYLFKYRIEYEWTFAFRTLRWYHSAGNDAPAYRRRWYKQKAAPQPVPLKPKTLGPSVMQAFPHAGQVQVSARMTFIGDAFKLSQTDPPLHVGPSRAHGIMQAFEHAELLSWATALAIAIFSGLSIYYVSAAGWGGFKDYLTMFLWGAGMETGKTFLQAAAGPK